MEFLQDALEQAVTGANGLENPLGVCADSPKDWHVCYQTYNETPWSATLTNLLGKHLSASDSVVRVLDVGSGKLCAAINLMTGNGSNFEYTSVDSKVDAALHDGPLSSILKRRHVMADVFEDVLDVGTDPFDVAILDVEPHGGEALVYEKVKPFMKDSHLCILKHVGYIDLFGSRMADEFLLRYITSGNVRDFFAESDSSSRSRDVFVIMSASEVDLQARCQAHADGDVLRWCDGHPAYVKHRSHA